MKRWIENHRQKWEDMGNQLMGLAISLSQQDVPNEVCAAIERLAANASDERDIAVEQLKLLESS